jgi:hypothetical protein
MVGFWQQEGSSMSMIAQFVQVAPDHLARLLKDPSGTEDLFAALPPASDTLPASLEHSARISPSAHSARISIDKSWHGIHYLLCAAAQPTTTLISQAIMGGTEVGEDFSGYGPARYFTIDETAAMSAELNRKTLEAEMTTRFNPAQMTKDGIYPNQWAGPDVQWLMREFRHVREFYAAASGAGFALVTCLV